MLRIGLAAGMVSRHHLIAWRAQSHRAQVVAIADPSDADGLPFETSPADSFETLPLMQDCHALVAPS